MWISELFKAKHLVHYGCSVIRLFFVFGRFMKSSRENFTLCVTVTHFVRSFCEFSISSGNLYCLYLNMTSHKDGCPSPLCFVAGGSAALCLGKVELWALVGLESADHLLQPTPAAHRPEETVFGKEATERCQ